MNMNLTRSFADQEFSLNKKLILEKPSSHHLLKVLRKKEGDEIVLFDGITNLCAGLRQRKCGCTACKDLYSGIGD